MAQTLRTISKDEVRGPAVGVLFMAFFGTMWAYVGIMGLHGWGNPWVLIASLAVGVALFIGGCLLIFASRELSNQAPYVNGKERKNIGFRFNVIFVAEGLAILIAIAVCNVTGHAEFIPLVIALIVGIHFIPLAYLFQVRIYYFTGMLLCILPVITWLFFPVNLTLMNHQIDAYMFIVGFGSALILWGTSLRIWLMGKRLVGRVSNKLTDDLTY
ncbi:hypothetical protein [Oceanobacillus jeddahense]|uniref:Uncharacterized protein n=1 Tax=Oceanobacillus jeddahense TaxID=1462527 RepID=A0ABY5JQR2_9BACI|nr:hypothetical protein [Oceanobacillus jeddahense]UUI01406.1 hypothetical protein NP439_15250 [Oceanobacillus jeddahense]